MKPDNQSPATPPKGDQAEAVPNPDMQREDAGTADSGTEAANAMKQTSKTGEEKKSGSQA